MRQAVILVGGKASRLGTLSGDRPKPFLDIAGTPFIDRLIAHAKRQGIEEIILLAGHAAGWIKDHFTTSVPGITVKLAVEQAPKGTAGALLSAADLLDPRFLMLNGDSILDGNWCALHPLLSEDAAIALAVRTIEDTGRYGRVVMDGDQVTSFAEKTGGGAGEINAGIYAVDRDAVMALISGPASMEQDIIPSLVEAGRVRAARLDGYFIDIGLPDTLKDAQRTLDDNLRRPAVVFDRDNTLVIDKGYTHRIEDLVWTPGAMDAIRAANDAHYRVFVATNQAGIARGLYGEAELLAFHKAMQAQLHLAGAHIDGFYHCPHHPDGTVEGLSGACACRKPATGMLGAIFKDHDLDRAGSLMIGDADKDIACGEAFGLKALRYSGGSLAALCKEKGLFG